MSQTDWKRHSSNLNVDTIQQAITEPSEFQIEFVDLIRRYFTNGSEKTALEAGCEQATITFMLEGFKHRYALDLNIDIIKKLELFQKKTNQEKIQVVHGDMFDMPFENGVFDLIHNAGVLEHFNLKDRAKALAEYRRVLKDDGLMIIAIPNHYSFPYRSAYLFHNYLLRGLFWRWPAEYKIRDLNSEAELANLRVIHTHDIAMNTAYRFWRPFNFVGKILRKISRYFLFEGYLKVFVLKSK